MGRLKRFSVSIDSDLVNEFDNFTQNEYPTRSKAISDLINDFLLQKRKLSNGLVAGAISLVYAHKKRCLGEKITEVQHDFYKLIISSQHIHLDHDTCFEIVLVKGKAFEIERLFYRLKTIKGISNSYLTVSGIAKE